MAQTRRRTALYPGTFDPITDGHFDIIRRGALLFDRVIVGVADSPHKRPLFSLATRVDLVREACSALEGVEVRSFKGLVAEEYTTWGIDVVIKGLRSVADFESEFQQAQANRRLNPAFETVFFMPSDRNMCISSSVVRDIFSLGGDVGDFVPENVRRLMTNLRANGGQP